MTRILSIIVLSINFQMALNAQAVYVDCRSGNDNNPGTREAPVFSVNKAADIIRNGGQAVNIIKINPGIYVLYNHVPVSMPENPAFDQIVIEASILPDDPSWTPEKMPVIINSSLRGEIPGSDNYVVSFLVNESHVTIRGLKFFGYSYPHVRYFPVARLDRTKTDLLIQQCMFVGDANISQIQAGVIASGNGVRIDHCIFFRPRNTVVFFLDSGDGTKTGNGITNSVIYGASQAVWTVSEDKDFIFENNIVSDCRYVWARNSINNATYNIVNSIVVNNLYFSGVTDSIRLRPRESSVNLINVVTNGKVTLSLTGIDNEPTLNEVDKPLPIAYMHPLPGSSGYDLRAGLFMKRKSD